MFMPIEIISASPDFVFIDSEDEGIFPIRMLEVRARDCGVCQMSSADLWEGVCAPDDTYHVAVHTALADDPKAEAAALSQWGLDWLAGSESY